MLFGKKKKRETKYDQTGKYPVYEMELINAGEDFHAAMKRSTNGGGENSPALEYQEDFYDFFLQVWKINRIMLIWQV